MTASAGYADFASQQSPELLRIGWLLTGTWPAAEELVQTTLAHAYLHWSSADAAQRPAWVRSLVLRTYVHSDPPRPVDPGDAVQRALAGLLPRQRAVAVLRHYVGLTEQQTAVELRTSARAVHRDDAAALAGLRRLVADPASLPTRLRELTPEPPPDSAVDSTATGTFTVPGTRPTSVWVAFAVAALIVALLAALVLAIRTPGPEDGSGLPSQTSSAASSG
jgi:DNA-directed RNA polymerase specialized sigma24 family protein